MKSGEPSEPPTLPLGLFTLHPALDTLSTFIYVKDRDLRIVTVNRAYCEVLGVSREDLIGKPTEPLLGEDGPASARIDREVIESGTPRRGIVERFVATDGLHWVATDKSPIRGPDGTVIGLIGTSVDITAQRHADERLRQSESQLRFLTEHMADILWTMDLQFHTTFVTSSITRVLGFTPEERRLQSLQEMVTPETAGRILTELQRQLQFEASGSAERDRTLTIDVEYYRKDGSTAWLETLIQAVRDEAGTLVGMVGVSRDITQRLASERATRESERLLRATEQLSRTGGWTYDAITGIMTWTQGVYDIHELPRDSTTPGVDMGIAGYPGEAQTDIERAFKTALADGVPYDLELPFVTAKGNSRWVRTVGHPQIRDGKVVGVTGNIMDVTSQHEATAALSQSEEKYRALFDLSKDAVYLVAPDGHFLEVNQAWIDLFGYSREDASGLHVDAIYEDPLLRRECFLPKIAQEGECVNWDVRFKKRDGTVMDCLCSVVARRDQSGAIICLQGMVRDVTDQKRAQRELQNSEERYRTLFEQSVDAINLVGVDGKIIDANPAWFALFGYTPGEMGSFNAADAYVEPEGRTRFLQRIAEQYTVEDDSAFRRKDGSVFDCHRVVTARRAPDGSIVAYQTVFHDVTETRKAEQALRESEQKYRAIFDQSVAPISLFAHDGSFIEANDAWFRLFGYTRSDAPAFNAVDLYATRPDREETILHIVTSGVVNDEARMQTKGGTPIDVQRSIALRRNPDGSILGFQTVWRDITAEKAAEQALRQSEEKYRQIVYQSIVPISLISLDGRIIEANDAWLNLLGYTREDVPSFNAASLFDKPEDRHAFVEHVLRSGHLDNYESHIRRKDGTCIDVLRSISVRYNPDGSILGFQTIMRDVTELNRTRDELLSSREQLRHLALRIQDAREEERTSIARELHDQFGQGLTALRLDLESLTKSRPPSGDSGLVRIRSIMQLVDQMSQELRRVISAARPGMLDDLGLCAALEWQAGQFSERTGIATNLVLTADDAAFPPSVSTALFRTFQELLSNVERHARATYVDVSLVSDRDSVYLAVVDNGRGITDDELHSPASLGILGVQERIRSCGGTVTFHGEPGKGTTVTVTVPLHTDTANGRQARLGLH